MRPFPFRGRLTFLLVLVCMLFAVAIMPTGAEPPSPPPYYAITHVTVASSGRAISVFIRREQLVDVEALVAELRRRIYAA